jgi:ketosteroid isomerase-like protein
METPEQRLRAMYVAFNDRDIDGVLGAMTPDVDWPNGWEGGRVLGHAAVRDYWTRQWAEIDPVVEPVSIAADDGDRVAVEVRQVIRDRDGNPLSDDIVVHAYTFRDGLVARMDIEAPTG